jgi:uncharacterized peroxidase-related enzyme
MLLEYVATDVDDDRLQTLFETDAETYGHPSLFARTLANNPDVLAARQEYVSTLAETGDLDERLTELVYTAVATANDCEYCVASHTDRLVEHSGLDDEIVTALADPDTELEEVLPERERTVVSVAKSIATDPKRVSSEDIESLREEGFDDESIVELVIVAGAGISATVVADTLNILPQDSDSL